MNLGTTLLFYGVVGVAVAAAVLVRPDRLAAGDRAFRAATALLFWPLYLPLLLEPASTSPSRGAAAPATALGEFGAAIDQVEGELDAALASLDGWTDAALGREEGRFIELRAAWRQQAARIVDLDQLLDELSEPDETKPETAPRIAASANARRGNVERLRGLRRRLHEDLDSTLAKVRELVTLIHLARFTGAPAARAEELVAQIADAVAGLSEVATWRERQA